MTAWRRAAAALVLLAAVPAPAYAADEPVPSSTLFSIDDDEVFESSGLVDRGATVYTVNDSGDDAVVYGLDARTGRTVSRTTYDGQAEDVEAMAPGRDGTLWVGDTGDNRARRDDIRVYRMRPRDGAVDSQRLVLTYPDGARDAETLLVHPRTQRVFVVSKSPFGGTVYAAPVGARPGSTHRLRAFARVAGLVTDGTFFPDGRHVLLRTYGTASVYDFPSFRLRGTVELPRQPQGEGISVSATGRVLVSSEGVGADVLRVRLPATLLASDSSRAAASPGPVPATPAPTETNRVFRGPGDAKGWIGVGVVAAAVAGAGVLLTRLASGHKPPRR